MIIQLSKVEIYEAWKSRKKGVVVRDWIDGPREYRDFNLGYLRRMDDGLYSVDQTAHELIIHWREMRREQPK